MKSSKKSSSKKSNNKPIIEALRPDELTPIRKFFISNYKSSYLNFPTSKKIQKYINNPQNDVNYLYSSAYGRIHAFTIFGYKITIDIVNTITVTFKVRDMLKESEAIFSFGYYEELTPKTIKGNSYILDGSNAIIRYFVLGGSYVSKDGEYRACVISGSNLRYIYNNPDLRKISVGIVEYLKDKLVRRKFLISKEYFYPTDDKRSMEPNLEYYSYKLGFDLFALTWLNLMINLDLNIIENNLNEKYQKIMLKHKDEDLAYYRELKKIYPEKDIETLRFLINHIRFNDNSRICDTTKVGQKIIPLSISEAQNPFNLRYKPWREYLISIHLSDLVVNYVTPGFFIINQWYYIKNTRKGLFDNEIQYDKMYRSELADQITTLLTRANLYTHENITKKNKVMKNVNKTVESWLSNKFKTLSKKIQDPIEYAKEEIIMSNVALGFISEYVGRTIMDFVSLCKTSKYYNNLVGEPFTQKGYPLFAKYMFDVCYNLFCMNHRSGIIHGDLHLNNATIKASLYKNIRNIKDLKNPTVLYVLGKNEEEQYIFPTIAYNSCIIDFSRSIILPDKIDQLFDPSLPKSYAIINKLKEFNDDQVERLIHSYLCYTSDSEHNKDELTIIFRNKFEAVFKLLTVIDIFGFTKKLLHVFTLNDKTIVTPHKMHIELVKKINSYAESYLTTEMNKLISTKSYESVVIDMEWPIYTIIKKCFYEFLASIVDIGDITEVFNINNKLTFSLSKLEKFPSTILSKKGIVYDKKVTTKTNEQYMLQNERYKYEKNKEDGMKIVNYIATRQREKHT